MKKLVYRAFGGLDVLELADVDVPEPGPREVLVRVKAAAINPVDWKMREGQLKILSGWRFPQGQGLEFAGIVERVGAAVTEYAVGDEVFGGAKACIAELTTAKVKSIAKKPGAVSFAAASTIPAVGTTAASALGKVDIGRGTEVLVNGATGGIGMFFTQLAVRRGATVTAVVSNKGMELVKRWGVHDAIDYRTHDILELGRRFDVVVELSDKLSFKKARPLLKARGTYVASLPNPAEMLPGFFGNLYSKQKYALMGMAARTGELESLAREVVDHLEVVVGKTFPLHQFREAYAQAYAGKILGKVVFTPFDSDP